MANTRITTQDILDLTITTQDISASAVTPDKAALTASWDYGLGTGSTLFYKTPVSGTEVAIKSYVDAVAAGVRDPKDAVRVTTGTQLSLTGLQTIDDITVVQDDRVLVRANSGSGTGTDGEDNGIYLASTGAWVRATDADEDSEVTSGLYTLVTTGTLFASAGYILVNDDPVTVDLTGLKFVQFNALGQINAGAGLTKSGNTLNVGDGAGLTVNADDIDVNAGDGIIIASDAVTVGAGDGIIVNTNDVAADPGLGISVDAGGINVVAGAGIQVNATDVSIATDVVGDLTGVNAWTGTNTFSDISGTILHNQNGDSYLVAGTGVVIDSSSLGDQIIISANTGSGVADNDATYLVVSLTGSLNAERAVTSSLGVKFTDGGANSTFDFRIDEAVIPTLSGANAFARAQTFNGGLSGSLQQLPNGSSYLVAGDNITITSGSGPNGQITISAAAESGTFADNDATYLVVSLTSSLNNERAATGSLGVKLDDGGANGNFDWRIDEAVIPTLSGANAFARPQTFNGGLSGSLQQLPNGNSYLVGGDGVTVISGSGPNGQITLSVDTDEITGSFADLDATYLVVSLTSSLPNERAATGSLGIKLDDGGANGNFDWRVDEAVIPTLSGANAFARAQTFNGGLSGSLQQLPNGTSYLVEGDDKVSIVSGSGPNGQVTISLATGSIFNCHIFGEEPAGPKPGTTFTTANGWISGTLRVYRRGIRLLENDDYTVSGQVITLDTSLAAGQNLLVDYINLSC